jgi:hypothetical protein
MSSHQVYSPEGVERLYEKASKAGQSPRHEANHSSIYQRFTARTKPIVVFAHPPVLLDQRKRPLAHENVMGNLCSGKLSLILIGCAVLNRQNVESYAQFDRREYAAHLYGTLRYSSVDGEDGIQCGL